MASKPQSSKFDWRAIVVPLSEEELNLVFARFNHPLVIQYFKNLAYEAVLEQAVVPIDALIKAGEEGHRIMAAYTKGKLEIPNAVLTQLEVLQGVTNNGTSTGS